MKSALFIITFIIAQLSVGEIHIPGPKMEVIIGLNYDVLIDSYNSLNFGIGIAKLF